MTEHEHNEAQQGHLSSMLGWGYNVFGAIADPGFATQPLFRSEHTRTISVAPGVEWTVPDYTSFLRHDAREKRTVFASSRTEWLQEKSQQYGLKGKFGFFSGQAALDFKGTQSSEHERDYFEIIDEVSLGYCSMPTDRTSLRARLDASFAAALDSGSPEDLFETYGTHYVSQLRIGGFIRFLGRAERDTSLTDSSRKAGIKAAFNNAVSSAEFSAKFSSKEKSYGESVRRTADLSVRGGLVGTAQRVSDPEDADGVAQWVASVPAAPAVLDFGPSHSVIPIWQLATDAPRRHALEEAFVHYARKHGHIFEPPTIVAISNEIHDPSGGQPRRVMRLGAEPPPNARAVLLLTTQDRVQDGGSKYGRNDWKLHVRVAERSGHGDGIEYVEVAGKRSVIVGGYQTLDTNGNTKYQTFGVVDDRSTDHRSIGRCRVRRRQLGLGGALFADSEVWLVLAPDSSWTGPRFAIVGGFDANVLPGTLGPTTREYVWGESRAPMTIPTAKCMGWSETRRNWGDSTLTFCYRQL